MAQEKDIWTCCLHDSDLDKIKWMDGLLLVRVVILKRTLADVVVVGVKYGPV